MNMSAVAGGIILLAIGGVAFGLAYNRVTELQTPLGQLARALNPSLQEEYFYDQFIEVVFGLLALGGLGFVIGGAAMKEKPRLGSSLTLPPSQSSAVTTFSRTYCQKCGAQLSEEDLYCRKCGTVVPSQQSSTFHA